MPISTQPKLTDIHIREVLAFTLFRLEKSKEPLPQNSAGDTWRKSPAVREEYRERAEALIRLLELEAGFKVSTPKPQLAHKLIADMITQPAYTVYTIDDLLAAPAKPPAETKASSSNV